MIEFFLKHYTLITYSVEFLAAITGLLIFNRYRNVGAKYFIVFLLFVAVCDTLSFYTFYVRPNMAFSFLIGTKFEKNHWFTTLFWSIGAIVFFSFYYQKILRIEMFKTIIKHVNYAFVIISILYILFHWEAFFNTFFPLINISGAFIIFLCTMFYFLETLQSDRILTFYKSINFYISGAIFIWWLIITPLVFYDEYYRYEIGKTFLDLQFASLRKQIYLFANLFMYLTFTFALLWCKPEND